MSSKTAVVRAKMTRQSRFGLLVALMFAAHWRIANCQAELYHGRTLRQFTSEATPGSVAEPVQAPTVSFEQVECQTGFPTYYSVDEGSFDITLFRSLLAKNNMANFVTGNSSSATMFIPTSAALYARLGMLGIDLDKTQSSPEIQEILTQHLIVEPDPWVQFAEMMRQTTQTTSLRLPSPLCKNANSQITMQQTQDKGVRAQMVMESYGTSARIMPAHDILVCGKVIHIIDDVLLPCCQASLASVQQLPSMKEYFTSQNTDVQLFYKVLQSQLQTSKAKTIFIPTSAALEEQLYTVKGLSRNMDAAAKTELFTALAQYHLAPTLVTVSDMAKSSLFSSLSYTTETVMSIGRDPLQNPNCIGTLQLNAEPIAPVGYKVEANAARPLRYTALVNETLEVVAEKSKAHVVAYWKICDGSIVYIIDGVLSPCLLVVPRSPPPPGGQMADEYGTLSLSDTPQPTFSKSAPVAWSPILGLLLSLLAVLLTTHNC